MLRWTWLYGAPILFSFLVASPAIGGNVVPTKSTVFRTQRLGPDWTRGALRVRITAAQRIHTPYGVVSREFPFRSLAFRVGSRLLRSQAPVPTVAEYTLNVPPAVPEGRQSLSITGIAADGSVVTRTVPFGVDRTAPEAVGVRWLYTGDKSFRFQADVRDALAGLDRLELLLRRAGTSELRSEVLPLAGRGLVHVDHSGIVEQPGVYEVSFRVIDKLGHAFLSPTTTLAMLRASPIAVAIQSPGLMWRGSSAYRCHDTGAGGTPRISLLLRVPEGELASRNFPFFVIFENDDAAQGAPIRATFQGRRRQWNLEQPLRGTVAEAVTLPVLSRTLLQEEGRYLAVGDPDRGAPTRLEGHYFTLHVSGPQALPEVAVIVQSIEGYVDDEAPELVLPGTYCAKTDGRAAAGPGFAAAYWDLDFVYRLSALGDSITAASGIYELSSFSDVFLRIYGTLSFPPWSWSTGAFQALPQVESHAWKLFRAMTSRSPGPSVAPTVGWTVLTSTLFSEGTSELPFRFGVQSTNAAEGGSRAAEIPAQALLARGRNYTTFAIGGNDICRDAPFDDLASFQTELETTMIPALRLGLDTLLAANPGVKIAVVPVPDLERLYELGLAGDAAAVDIAGVGGIIGAIHTPEESCQARWDLGVCRIDHPFCNRPTCRSLLGSGLSSAQRSNGFAALRRYNERLAALVLEPAYRNRVRYVPSVATHRFVDGDVSRLDCYHPSVQGHNAISNLVWQSGWFSSHGRRQ